MIGDNIKKLRETLGYTQTKFAERIGIKQNTIASAESNKRALSQQALTSICREFKVRMEWLKTGEGEMYETRDESIMERLKAEYNLSAKSIELIENFLKLPPATRDLVATAIAEATKLYPRKPDNEKTREELHADLDVELDARDAAAKRGTITSSASTTSSGSLKKSGKSP